MIMSDKNVMKFYILLFHQISFYCTGWSLKLSARSSNMSDLSASYEERFELPSLSQPLAKSSSTNREQNVSSFSFPSFSKLPTKKSEKSSWSSLESPEYNITSRLPISSASNKIIAVQTNCTRDTFRIQIELNKKFRGVLFAKDFLEECRSSKGIEKSKVSLKIPTSGCGVRLELKPNGSLEFSVKVMLQMDEKLRQSSDIEKVIKCTLPSNMMNMDVPIDMEKKKINSRNGRMQPNDDHHQNIPSRIRIWLELGGPEGTGTVEVGRSTTLVVRAVVPGTIGIKVVDCLALDGLRESSQQLLDHRGCPIDEQVMPELHLSFRPAEEGWSKPHEDNLVEKLFTATFRAFKFPDRERLHVSCGVKLCKGKCANVSCREEEYLESVTNEKLLTRIEVFNSLAVTAPQIEIDRRMNRKYNTSVEEHPPTVKNLHSDGILCFSISKLAMSFCVLGIIFLIAVIVAICCLIRNRSRLKIMRSHRTGSVFSSSSDTQSRLGSKLLISYPCGAGGHTGMERLPSTSLPYGRVY